LHAQLTAIKWEPNSAGQVVIESKEDMAKRVLPSPDHADACMMACVGSPSMLLPDEDELVSGITDDLLDRKM
jgi:hypothetical protein